MNIALLADTAPEGMGLTNILMIVGMIAVFYFFLIRPQSKKRKEEEAFRKSIGKGDKVITIGGIHGKVTSVQDDTLVIAVEEGAKLRILKSAVSLDGSSTLNPDGGSSSDKKVEKEEKEAEKAEA